MIYDVCTDQTQWLYLIHGHGCLYNVHSSICNQYWILKLDWSPINPVLFPLGSCVVHVDVDGSRMHWELQPKRKTWSHALAIFLLQMWEYCLWIFQKLIMAPLCQSSFPRVVFFIFEWKCADIIGNIISWFFGTKMLMLIKLLQM